jgi:histidine triad (HIT) family protein
MSQAVLMPDRACTFCAIAAGDLDAEIVLDEPAVLAFLDVAPLFPGHTLVIPRDHHVTLADLPTATLVAVFTATQRLSLAVRDATGATGSFVAVNNVVSQSVPHHHVHVVPRTKGDGLRGFFWPRTRYAGDDHRMRTGASIRAALSHPAG